MVDIDSGECDARECRCEQIDSGKGDARQRGIRNVDAGERSRQRCLAGQVGGRHTEDGCPLVERRHRARRIGWQRVELLSGKGEQDERDLAEQRGVDVELAEVERLQLRPGDRIGEHSGQGKCLQRNACQGRPKQQRLPATFHRDLGDENARQSGVGEPDARQGEVIDHNARQCDARQGRVLDVDPGEGDAREGDARERRIGC